MIAGRIMDRPRFAPHPPAARVLPSPRSRGEGRAEGRGSPSPRSPVRRLKFQVAGDLSFPPVAVIEQLFLVVEELLAGLGREFEIRPLDDRIDRAGLLAEAAIDALGHVDVVARGAAAAVGARLRLDGDGERGTHGLAELAGDAALLA